jgi:hypothetical protein
MSAPTTQEMLDNVNTAINGILTGGGVQSYSINGRSLTKYSLGELQTLKKDLQAQLAAESGDGRVYAAF